MLISVVAQMRLAACVAELAWYDRYLVLYRAKEKSLGIDVLWDSQMEQPIQKVRERWGSYRPEPSLSEGLPIW